MLFINKCLLTVSNKALSSAIHVRQSVTGEATSQYDDGYIYLTKLFLQTCSVSFNFPLYLRYNNRFRRAFCDLFHFRGKLINSVEPLPSLVESVSGIRTRLYSASCPNSQMKIAVIHVMWRRSSEFIIRKSKRIIIFFSVNIFFEIIYFLHFWVKGYRGRLRVLSGICHKTFFLNLIVYVECYKIGKILVDM